MRLFGYFNSLVHFVIFYETVQLSDYEVYLSLF